MPRIFPLHLRPQTAIYKPSRRGGLIIPNHQEGGAPVIPDVLTGLVSQADVQTNGNVDVVPFDNILGNLGTAFGGAGVDPAAGDGGYAGMLFDKNSSQYITLPSTVDNNLFLEGDFTMAARFKSTASGEMALYAFGPTALCSMKVSQNAGDPQGFCIDDGSQFTSVGPVQAGSNDGAEHVVILRRQGNRVQLGMDLTLLGDVDGNYGNNPSTTTDHQEWATFFDDTPIIFLSGTIFWSAAWSRLLSDTQATYLSALPNPFGRTA